MSHSGIPSRALVTLGPTAARAIKLSRTSLLIASAATALSASTLWALLPALWLTATGAIAVGLLFALAWFVSISSAWPKAVFQLREEAAVEALEAEKRLRELRAAREREEAAQFDELFRKSLTPAQRYRRLPWEPKWRIKERAVRVAATIRRVVTERREPEPEVPRHIVEPRRRSSFIGIGMSIQFIFLFIPIALLTGVVIWLTIEIFATYASQLPM